MDSPVAWEMDAATEGSRDRLSILAPRSLGSVGQPIARRSALGWTVQPNASCRLRHGAIAVLTVAFILLIASAARAQAPDPSYDLDRLTLDPSGEGTLLSDAGRVLPPGALRFAGAMEYQHDPLMLPGESGPAALVSNRLALHLLAAYGVSKDLEVTAWLPVVAVQGGDDLSRLGYVSPDAAGIANPAIGLRYALLRRPTYDLAARLGLGLPLGMAGLSDGTGWQKAQLEPGLEAGAAMGPVRTALDVDLLFAPFDASRPAREVAIQAAAQLATNAFHPELTLRALVPFDGAAGFEAWLGARHSLGSLPLQVFALAGAAAGDLAGLPGFRVLAGVTWSPGLATPVVERPIKKAPEVVAVEKVVKEAPPKTVVPKKVKPPPSNPCAPGQHHSPAQCPNNDDDGDGLINKNDRCPLEKGPASNDGCPLADHDRDGVPDLVDACPDSPGPASNLGCPVTDTDHDGVPDVVDNCPDVPGPATNHGCPMSDPQHVYIVREVARQIRSRLKFSTNILFAFGDTQVSPESRAMLDQLVRMLARHPELTHLRVEGYTDNVGRPEKNLKLSQARAQAVMAYLESRGIAKARLSAKGFGSEKPVDANTTPEGRARNRRVELVSTDACGGT